MPSTDGSTSRDASPGPSRIRNFKNAGKDMEVCMSAKIVLKILNSYNLRSCLL